MASGKGRAKGGQTMKRLAIAGAVLLVLSGCALAARDRARNDLEQSKAAYKECLQQHPDDASACEVLQKIYEADLQALRALSRRGTVTIEE